MYSPFPLQQVLTILGAGRGLGGVQRFANSSSFLAARKKNPTVRGFAPGAVQSLAGDRAKEEGEPLLVPFTGTALGTA